MKSVLFVDDEQHVLDGLQDRLRKQRKLWHMEFALGGQRAFAALDQRPFDVVVCDMRMPGIDGAAVLAHVKQLYPAAARIVLSGQADSESMLRALPTAHQFLSKPCDAKTIEAVIEQTYKLQQLLSDGTIRNIVGGLDHLPSTPRTYWELTQAAARPDARITDFAGIVEQDPAMAAKVLQLVNSAYFGLPQGITSVQRAVSRLGVELLKALSLSAHAFGTVDSPTIRGFSVERVQQHSLHTARLCQLFVKKPGQAAELFAAAMMHDVGKLVLAQGTPERFAQILELQETTQRPAFELERELLGVTHAEVGAYLLGSWGLPFALVEAVAFHHTPATLLGGNLELVAALHVADVLADGAEYASHESARTGKLDSGFIESAGLSDQLGRWRALASELRVP